MSTKHARRSAEEFGEWSASLLINVDRGAMLAAGGMEELPNQGVLEVVVLLLKLS